MTTRTATPPLSAPPLAVSHTVNATQELDSARSAPQARMTHHAPKLRRLVTKSAPSNPSQNATQRVLATSAKMAQTLDALTPPLVRLPANHTQTHTMINTDAHGTEPTQLASQTSKESKARPSVNNNAKNHPSLSATSRTTLARSATTTRIRIASKPLLSARLLNKKVDARPKN